MRTTHLLQVLLAATLAMALPASPSRPPLFDYLGDAPVWNPSSLDAEAFKPLLQADQSFTPLNLAFNYLSIWQPRPSCDLHREHLQKAARSALGHGNIAGSVTRTIRYLLQGAYVRLWTNQATGEREVTMTRITRPIG